MKRLILIIASLFVLLAVPAKAQMVDYYLPYPGYLPDHPLYWVKMVRDRVDLWLTFKQETKLERLLSYADKRLAAGWALVEKGKIDLGVSTLTKGEKYLDQAMVLSTHIEETKLNKAKLKHWEVLTLLKDKVGDKHQGVVTQMVERLSQQAQKSLTVTVLVDFDGLREQVEATASAQTPLAALQGLNLPLQVKTYPFGSLVEGVAGYVNSASRAWIYFVNNVSGDVAADQYQLTAGDEVQWRYTKPQ